MRSQGSDLDATPAKMMIKPRLGEDRYDHEVGEKKTKIANNNSGNLITINGKGFEVS